MKIIYKHIILLCLLVVTKTSFSQVVKGGQRFEITSKGQKIVVLPTYSDNQSFHPHYYLPTNLHVSEKNKVPEFSFLTYKKDDNSDNNIGQQGQKAASHFLEATPNYR